MGLDINRYRYSYSTLHELRKWALKVGRTHYGASHKGSLDKLYDVLTPDLSNTARKRLCYFYEFIDHSDCEGGYMSFTRFGIKKATKEMREEGFWGDLDRLKFEVKKLDQHVDMLEPFMKEAWDSFRDDILDVENKIDFT